MKMQTDATTRKVKGARVGGGAGGGIGASLAIIAIAIFEANGIQVDPILEAAIVVVIGGAVAAIGAHLVGYQTRPDVVDRIQAE